VPEVVTPSPQNGVDLPKQVGKGFVSASERQFTDLARDGVQGLLRRPGVNVTLGCSWFDPSLDVKAEKMMTSSFPRIPHPAGPAERKRPPLHLHLPIEESTCFDHGED
jgi:hypothetical protein